MPTIGCAVCPPLPDQCAHLWLCNVPPLWLCSVPTFGCAVYPPLVVCNCAYLEDPVAWLVPTYGCAYLEDPVACLVPTTRVTSCIGCPAPKPLNLHTHPARDASIATDCFCLSNFSKRLQGCSNQQEECSKSNSNATLHCTVYWEKKLYKKS